MHRASYISLSMSGSAAGSISFMSAKTSLAWVQAEDT